MDAYLLDHLDGHPELATQLALIEQDIEAGFAQTPGSVAHAGTDIRKAAEYLTQQYTFAMGRDGHLGSFSEQLSALQKERVLPKACIEAFHECRRLGNMEAHDLGMGRRHIFAAAAAWESLTVVLLPQFLADLPERLDQPLTGIHFRCSVPLKKPLSQKKKSPSKTEPTGERNNQTAETDDDDNDLNPFYLSTLRAASTFHLLSLMPMPDGHHILRLSLIWVLGISSELLSFLCLFIGPTAPFLAVYLLLTANFTECTVLLSVAALIGLFCPLYVSSEYFRHGSTHREYRENLSFFVGAHEDLLSGVFHFRKFYREIPEMKAHAMNAQLGFLDASILCCQDLLIFILSLAFITAMPIRVLLWLSWPMSGWLVRLGIPLLTAQILSILPTFIWIVVVMIIMRRLMLSH